MNTITNVFKFVIKCEALGLKKTFQETWFRHVFSKAYQYVTSDEIVCKGFQYVFIKSTQVDL